MTSFKNKPKVIAIVPARSGSKGFIRKNVARLGGKTLIELAILCGVDSPLVTEVVLSTDSTEYETIGMNAGARSYGLRSEALSSDHAKTIDVVLDLLDKTEEQFEYVLLLQPTSPVRSPKDIQAAFDLMAENDADACVTVSLVDDPHPFKLKSLNDQGFINPFIEGSTSEVSRQSLPKVYALTGAIYLIKTTALRQNMSFFSDKTVPLVMPNCLNIDTEEDYLFIKMLLQEKKISIHGINADVPSEGE